MQRFSEFDFDKENLLLNQKNLINRSYQSLSRQLASLTDNTVLYFNLLLMNTVNFLRKKKWLILLTELKLENV